mgnify:CR=1 FL=1
MIVRKKKRLGDLLVEEGVLTQEQLMEALKKQREMGLRLGETIAELQLYGLSNLVADIDTKRQHVPIVAIQ